jgi:hypothetical protein
LVSKNREGTQRSKFYRQGCLSSLIRSHFGCLNKD